MPKKKIVLQLTDSEKQQLTLLLENFAEKSLPLFVYVEQLMATAFSMGIGEGRRKGDE